MAGFIPAGVVATAKEDPFPRTGDHLDLRIYPQFGKNKGRAINPESIRTVAQNVLIGQNKIPLVQQTREGWKWNFPITSRFGPRTAPTAGASSFHQGIDIGVGAGTPIAYKGYGSYRPDHGFGSLMVSDPQGNPYEIRLLHTRPGKAASVGSTAVPAAPVLPGATATAQPTASDTRTRDILEAFAYGTQYQQPKAKEPSLKDALFAGVMQQAFTPQRSFLSRFIQQEPYLQGQGASINDYLSGLFG